MLARSSRIGYLGWQVVVQFALEVDPTIIRSFLFPSLVAAWMLSCPLAVYAVPNIYDVHVHYQEQQGFSSPIIATANLDGRFAFDSATSTISNVQLFLTNIVVGGSMLSDAALTFGGFYDNGFGSNTRTLQFQNSIAGATRLALLTFNNPPGLPSSGSISLNTTGTGMFLIPEMTSFTSPTASTGTITAAPEIDGASACLPLAWAAMGLALLSDRRRRRRFA